MRVLAQGMAKPAETTYTDSSRGGALEELAVRFSEQCGPPTPDRSLRVELTYYRGDSVARECRVCPDAQLIHSLPPGADDTRVPALAECRALIEVLGSPVPEALADRAALVRGRGAAPPWGGQHRAAKLPAMDTLTPSGARSREVVASNGWTVLRPVQCDPP